MNIHPTAVVDPRAQLDTSVIIGPYAVIDGPVNIGAETRIGAHAVLSGHTTLGSHNIIGSFAVIGGAPQDIHYKGEPTKLIIGNGNHIREYVSVHRASAKGSGETVIGNNNMIMAYCHVAHDCRIADHVIMTNVASLAGHVEVGSYANLGGLVAVHPFCRIGEFAYVGGMSGLSSDVPPYVMMEGTRHQMRIAGINKIGLRRFGMAKEALKDLEVAFKILFRSPEILLKDALMRLETEMPDCIEVQKMVQFFRSTKRGVLKRASDD